METNQWQRRIIYDDLPSSKDVIEVGSEWVLSEEFKGGIKLVVALEEVGLPINSRATMQGEHLKIIGILWAGLHSHRPVCPAKTVAGPADGC